MERAKFAISHTLEISLILTETFAASRLRVIKYARNDQKETLIKVTKTFLCDLQNELSIYSGR